MRYLSSALAVVVVAGLTLGSGYMQGSLRNRWGPAADLVTAAQLLEATPAEFGRWKLKELTPLTDSVVRMLECAGYVSGKYVDQETGDVVSMVVLLGPPGPISVHTPEICYSSRDYTQTGPRTRITVPAATGADAELWTVAFRAEDVEAHQLRVYYAWSDGSVWNATTRPRLWYAGKPYLYKLQLAAAEAEDAESGRDDPGLGFLRDFLPVLNRQLVTPSRSAAR